jgi:hypothetical protein
MPETDCIYEAPSPLSQGLVVGLSVAVALMAGWFVATVTVSQTERTLVEGDSDTTANPPPADATVAAGAADASQRHTTSVHFDWPADFASAASAPPRTALPLAPEVPAARDFGPPTWPAAADARDRSLPLRQPARTASEATDAVVDILASPASSLPPRSAAGRDATAAAPVPRPAASRRQKPRVESDAVQ